MCFLSTTFPNALAHPLPILFDQSLSNIQLTLIDIDQTPPGGGRVLNKCLYGETAPWPNPLPFYIPFLTKKVPLSFTFY